MRSNKDWSFILQLNERIINSKQLDITELSLALNKLTSTLELDNKQLTCTLELAIYTLDIKQLNLYTIQLHIKLLNIKKKHKYNIKQLELKNNNRLTIIISIRKQTKHQ